MPRSRCGVPDDADCGADITATLHITGCHPAADIPGFECGADRVGYGLVLTRVENKNGVRQFWRFRLFCAWTGCRLGCADAVSTRLVLFSSALPRTSFSTAGDWTAAPSGGNGRPSPQILGLEIFWEQPTALFSKLCMMTACYSAAIALLLMQSDAIGPEIFGASPSQQRMLKLRFKKPPSFGRRQNGLHDISDIGFEQGD